MERKTIFLVLLFASIASSHDTWLQTNTHIVRVGETVHVDLLLGNHGNNHRDFKIAGKAPLDKSRIEVVTPDGKSADIKPTFTDQGLAEKDGSWTARYLPSQAGLHLVSQTSDAVVSYAPKRSIKSAKVFFVASKSLDHIPADHPGFDKPLGHPLELVPQSNPVTPITAGKPIAVKLLYKNQPLAGVTVSFIPRGVTLKEGFDEQYERKTDEKGVASFIPREGSYYLVVAHHKTDEKGVGYDETSYSATLCVYVP